MSDLTSKCKSKALLKLGQVTVIISHYYREAMLEYCQIENRSKRSDVLMGFVRRIEASSSGIRSMVKSSIEIYDSHPYLKLPIGLLIRCCLLDSLQALYLSTLTKEDADELITSYNLEYVRSLPSRFEVYVDRGDLGVFGMDDVKRIYASQIEDVFTEHLDFSAPLKNHFIRIKRGPKSLKPKEIYHKLTQIKEYKELSEQLYAYFREYSQFEHFSEQGYGDSLIPYDEVYPIISKPFEYIASAVSIIGQVAGCNDSTVELLSLSRNRIKNINAEEKER